MTICSNCKQDIPNSVRFCPNCGSLQQPQNVKFTRVLVVFSNPTGTASLRLSAEDRIIRDAIYKGTFREKVGVDICHASTVHDMRHSLLQAEYRVIQFSGHSSGTEFLFEDQDGNIQKINFELFASFVAAHSPPLECVILNACSTLEQGKLLAFDVPFVIAMQAAIQDKAAIEFSHGFYDALAAGKDIEFAYQEGRRCMQMIGCKDTDLPILVKHTILNKYHNLPLGVRSNEYQRWYEVLSLGKLELRIDPQAVNEVNVLLAVFDKVLQEQGFDNDTIDRSAIVLWELVTNVARHIKNSPASVGIEVNTKYLPMVIISVADQGPGFKLRETVKTQYMSMKSGSPEHGLGRVCRLSDDVTQSRPSDLDPYHTIFCTLYTVKPPKSVFDKFPWCAKITVFFESPFSVWLGRARYPSWGGWGIASTFDFALENNIDKLLDIYMQHILVDKPQFLCIEVQGTRTPTEAPPFLLETLTKALEKYFVGFFIENRVILLHANEVKVYSNYEIDNFSLDRLCLQKLEDIDRKLSNKNSI